MTRKTHRHAHYIEICRHCDQVIRQCRCFGADKKITYGTCENCANVISNEIVDDKGVLIDGHMRQKIFEDFQQSMHYDFVKSFTFVSEAIHQTAVEKGWWESDRNTGEIFTLFHCEISEAFEAWRVENPQSEKIPDFTQIEEELADCIIRIMDYAQEREFDVSGAILAKMEYNNGRSYRHGGKKA